MLNIFVSIAEFTISERVSTTLEIPCYIGAHLILDVDGDGPLQPDGGHEHLDRAVPPHQAHHRRLHERQVRQRRRRQQKRLGRLCPLR